MAVTPLAERLPPPPEPFEAEVIRPSASTVISAFVYAPAVTAVAASSLAPTAPVAMCVAFTEFADKPVVPVIVTVSEVAFVVNVIPVPAASVKVSVALSATTLLCPETAIVLKLSEALPLDTVLNESAPLPSVVNT